MVAIPRVPWGKQKEFCNDFVRNCTAWRTQWIVMIYFSFVVASAFAVRDNFEDSIMNMWNTHIMKHETQKS